MDDLDLYQRIEYPNETRLSWTVEAEPERLVPVIGAWLRRVGARDSERLVD